MKNDPVLAALEKLDDIPLRTAEGRVQFVRALNAKSNLVVAKAARLIGNALWLEMAAELAAALERFLEGAADKGCSAKLALARALNQLEYDGAELFLAGMKCLQREPVWGGSEDVAAELRAVCAACLAGSVYPYKLRALVDLLADTEWPARAGAVRALAALGGDSATLLLRFKTLTGDPELEVFSDCLSGLLQLEGAAALPLVVSFTGNRQPEEIRDTAVLALGESRRADAVAALMEMFGRTVDGDRRKCILLALATSRSEAASEFLDELIRTGTPLEMAMATEAVRSVR